MSWARRFNNLHLTRAPQAVGEVLARGDVVLVRPTELREGEASRSKKKKTKILQVK